MALLCTCAQPHPARGRLRNTPLALSARGGTLGARRACGAPSALRPASAAARRNPVVCAMAPPDSPGDSKSSAEKPDAGQTPRKAVGGARKPNFAGSKPAVKVGKENFAVGKTEGGARKPAYAGSKPAVKIDKGSFSVGKSEGGAGKPKQSSFGSVSNAAPAAKVDAAKDGESDSDSDSAGGVGKPNYAGSRTEGDSASSSDTGVKGYAEGEAAKPAAVSRGSRVLAQGEHWWVPRTMARNFVHVRSEEHFYHILETAALHPQNSIPVVVDFFATWCNSCRTYFPKHMKMVEEEQQILFLMVDYDDNREWAQKLGVTQLPMLHIYNGSTELLHSQTCSMAPMRVKALRETVIRHKAPRCRLPDQGERTITTEELTRKHPVEFTWSEEGAEDVLVSGEPFGSWQTMVPLTKRDDGTFVLTYKVNPGTYRFKFIVDGRWRVSPKFPKDADRAGFENNVITVREADWPFVWRWTGATVGDKKSDAVADLAAVEESTASNIVPTVPSSNAANEKSIERIVDRKLAPIKDDLYNIKILLEKLNMMVEDELEQD